MRTKAEQIAAIRADQQFWRDLAAGKFSAADAMYAPVVTRFLTYDVKLDDTLSAYATTIMQLPEMQEWVAAAKREPEIEELEVEF